MAKRPEDLLRDAVAKFKRVTDVARGAVPAREEERPAERPGAPAGGPPGPAPVQGR